MRLSTEVLLVGRLCMLSCRQGAQRSAGAQLDTGVSQDPGTDETLVYR